MSQTLTIWHSRSYGHFSVYFTQYRLVLNVMAKSLSLSSAATKKLHFIHLLFSLSLSLCGFCISQAKMMHMTIHWGKNVTLLFDSWTIDSWTSYALTLLVCFLFSVSYQNLEDQRLRFKTHPSNNPASRSNGTPLLSKIGRGRTQWVNSARFVSAVLFGVSSAMEFLLMLAIMSFNGGVFVAIVVGLSVGYFLFRTRDEELLALVDSS